MSKKYIFVSLLFTVLAFSNELNAAENQPGIPEIIWYRAYFPPVTITEGDNRDSGFFDKAMDFVIDRLPEYSHKFQTANFKRIVKEIANNDNVCCPSLYKTNEREQYVEFSIPAMVRISELLPAPEGE